MIDESEAFQRTAHAWSIVTEYRKWVKTPGGFLMPSDPLEKVLNKFISVGLLRRKQEIFRLGPPDLDSALPALQSLTERYGRLEGYEAEVLARIPPLLFATGPLSLMLIRYVLEESGVHAERRA